MTEETLILGTEYDRRMRGALHEALRDLGGTVLRHESGIGGSQEIETLDVEIAGERVSVEAETYAGLSISGPSDLVRRVQRLMNERLGQVPGPD